MVPMGPPGHGGQPNMQSQQSSMNNLSSSSSSSNKSVVVSSYFRSFIVNLPGKPKAIFLKCKILLYIRTKLKMKKAN